MTIASEQPETPSETTSLLAEHNELPVQPKSVTRRAQQVLFLACLLAVTVDIGSYISVAPQLQIYELNICQHLHPEVFDSSPGGVLSSLVPSACKTADVQGELALLKGWMSTFDQLPGIILALPYGLMADRVGRKPVLFLSLAGCVLQEMAIRVIAWYHATIPPRAIWFTPIFQILGGGSQIATSVAFTIIADVFPVEKRSSTYFILSAAMLLSEILAVPLSAWLMSSNAWIPWMLGLACEFGSLFTILFLPETKPEPSVNPVNDVQPETAGHLKLSSAFTWASAVLFARSQFAQLHEFIGEYPSALVISLAFLFSSYGIEAVPFMLQYVSKRFSWSLAEASLLICVKGIINCFALMLVLPMATKILDRYLSPVQRDLRVAIGCACLLMAAYGFMSVASHPAVFVVGVALVALGGGFSAALRSVGSALVGSSHVGLLNTTITLTQGVGLMISGPLLAGLFRAGMAWEGAWMGLPWMAGFILCAATILTVYCLQVQS
ncbi:MFS transporter [Aspergillus eucalypticola CBS 122712]|uniref:MFS transporter n=1 Tax=Aspergillus eucalypticola (strain CBS 122712 / IBT 29274) TaxID=1448314 RepID=A0A317V3K9_ASPEC|nr:MFS transporter [Aspergillus eucalypticola CBS 122712]PWY67437.1 MFS transporter [Aspergillus eucalypticola CBS 122712]